MNDTARATHGLFLILSVRRTNKVYTGLSYLVSLPIEYLAKMCVHMEVISSHLPLTLGITVDFRSLYQEFIRVSRSLHDF